MWPYLAGIFLAMLVTPAVLTKVRNPLPWLRFDEHSAAVATTIGSITGPILSSATLLFLLASYFLNNREQNMRLSFELIDRLVSIYGGILSEYERFGKPKAGVDVANQPGVIMPYLERINPLFNEVLTRLNTSLYSETQYRALVSILKTQLIPIVEEMHRQTLSLGQGTAIADAQLTRLHNL